MAMEKLIFKLKMPPTGDKVRFDCPICSKSFSSGKGLGGHKRTHMEMEGKSTNDHQRTTTELQINLPENNATDEKIFPCPICQQLFPSEKSVHGHMRKHPDRDWRGMRPPIPQFIGKSGPFPLLLGGNNSADDHNKGDKLAIASNSGLAERRRRHGKAPMDLINPSTNSESISVACDLMTLAKDGRQPRLEENSEPKKKKLELSVSSNAGNPGPVILGGGYYFRGLEVAASSIQGKNSMFVNKGQFRKTPIKAEKKYVCDICFRSFKTFQALGGHKSHHNLKEVAKDDESAANNAATYQCSICDKIFSTDDALSNHSLRCSGPLHPIISEVPPCPGGEENGNQLTVFSFDLNELPPEATGAEGDGS